MTSPIRSRALGLLTMLLASASCLTGQQVQRVDAGRDSVRKLVAQRRAEIDRAAERFLDSRLSITDRLAAVKGVSTFLSPAHVAGALKVAFDATASPQYRAPALRLGMRGFLHDPSAQARLLVVLSDRATPAEVRHEAMDVVEEVIAARPLRGVDSVLRMLTADPDPSLRDAALARLALRGDSGARSRLIDGLRQPARAALPEEVALALLAAHPDANVVAVAQDVLKSRPDGQARRLAMRIAAASESGRKEILRILVDSTSPAQLRVVAVQALVVQDPAAFTRATAAILRNESENDSLRVAIIDALRLRGPGEGTSEAVELESNVRRALRDTRSSTVRAAAMRFLEDRNSS